MPEDREAAKQRSEIEAWLQMREELGEHFLEGEPVRGDLESYRGSVIVDVGCGPRPFVEHFPARLAVMVDCCMGGYRRAGLLRPSSVEKVLCVEAMGEALPIQDGSVDHVFALNMLDHTFAPAKVAEEFRRIAAPGGSIHVYVDIGGAPTPCEPVVFSREDIPELFPGLEIVFEDERPPSHPDRDAMMVHVFRRPGPQRARTEAAQGSDLRRYLEILACPRCRGSLLLGESALRCSGCGGSFCQEGGVLLMSPSCASP